jgi:hypothetical protein
MLRGIFFVLVLTSPLCAQTVEFNRDIRPIFSDRCYTCHGPSSTTRKSKLRFDTEKGAKQDLGGRFAIVPGDVEHSEILQRISAGTKPTRMPPAYTGPGLSDHEIDLIRRWIAQGAVWEKHWSFIPPKRKDPPAVSDPKWPRNPIDSFVLAGLDHESLKPSPEADRMTLLRRVTFDLTGLPPTLAEMDAFARDSSPNAYEKVVDRLLASPRYGEHMAIRWLDAARYADTNGYQTDGERFMWRWRDWVIDAFNRNMPYDEFTVEQIAGDMLPNATLEQRIASGFNRNHRGNGEGGIVPAEYAVEYVVDRVDTTSTVFMGLTVGCARCHDHKYDPISQKEFYQLYAYFDNIPERGNAQKFGNSPPFIKAPTPGQQARLKSFDTAIADARQKFALLNSETMKGQQAWERQISAKTPAAKQWFNPRGLAAEFPLDAETGRPEGAVTYGAGRIGDAASFDGHSFINAGNTANFGYNDKITLAAWIFPTAADGAILSRAKDEPEGSGYSVLLKNGKVQANLVLRWLDDAIRLETRDPIELNRWHHVAVTFDGSHFADGVKIYVDGTSRALTVNLDAMNQNFASKEPLRIGAGGGPANRFHGQIDEVRLYKRELTPADIAVLATPESLDEIAGLDPAKRSVAQKDKLRLAWLDEFAPYPIQGAWKKLLGLNEQRDSFFDTIPTVMVMQERPEVRDTFLLKRGAYDHPGDKVERGVPAVLPPLPKGVENNRLGLARWLVDPSNPLTARVAVNRFWESYFGTGIVKTVEDFGSQGEWPSNPELLDWLATEFVRTGWDVKAMQKTIVMSATYRQTSKASTELLQRDPENRLLARGPRFRMPAEEVRDQALADAGLLVEKLGGPSVKPYQPAGLWKELSGGEDYVQDRGEGLYRRSLYTFWKRASPPPMMVNFDAAGREACTVRETRTNTPLQALDLMNDVTFIEASRMLAQRMMKEGGTTPEERIAFAFRLATARTPGEKETGILLNSYRYTLDRFSTEADAATKLLSEGDSSRDRSLDPKQLAAYTAVASLILNLDETVTLQ